MTVVDELKGEKESPEERVDRFQNVLQSETVNGILLLPLFLFQDHASISCKSLKERRHAWRPKFF